MVEELYTGPKFDTKFLVKNPPSHMGLDKLIHWCSVFHKENLTPIHESGTAGNLSFRVKNEKFIITGAGLIGKCTLTPADFVFVEDCNIAERSVVVSGERLPSSESMMHFAIYKNLPEVNAIFHGHHHGLLHSAKRMGIPITSRVCPYGSEKLIESILPMLGKTNFFMIREHGFLSLGKTMDEAGENVLFHLKNLNNLELK